MIRKPRRDMIQGNEGSLLDVETETNRQSRRIKWLFEKDERMISARLIDSR